ncbi:hypothetical protein [Frankia sp. Cppng1_Ct_nod]|uniref:hypothetical protein n=1 Tax=Frankia sp. Cppng1_Ct_nod TaxID=2897162 RepID=UPI001A9440C0|nr:hypothetical protein [Frankia sp. Cppng1_Ct_nod]
MPSETLTSSEVGILLALMAEATEVSNPELKNAYGLTLDGASRKKLNDLKLVESRRAGRPFLHELTDSGWARCRAELSAPRPKRGGVAVGALYAVLAGVNRYLEQEGLVPADVFRPAGESPPEAESATPAPPATDPGGPDLEARIRDAYQQLAKHPGSWVSLARLRPLLGDAEQADVDAALRRMDRGPRVSLIPEENQKTLAGRDRAAAVNIGGQDNHLLAIEDA